MAWMNIDILGISELKWTRIDKFNWDDHYIYYCGQESLRKKWSTPLVNKRVQNALLGCNLKNNRMILVCFQGKPFTITVIQVYALTTNAKEAEVEQFYEDLKDLDEAQAGIKIAGRNISNLRYGDDTILMTESKEELKSLLMKVKEDSEKVGLKLSIQ